MQSITSGEAAGFIGGSIVAENELFFERMGDECEDTKWSDRTMK